MDLSSLDRAASFLNEVTGWLYPVLWLAVALFAVTRGLRSSALVMGFAGLSQLLFQLLFFPGSPFTQEWPTDSPLNISASYHLLGFLASNLLPLLNTLGLAVAYVLAIRRA
jgi:hypothetical protein